MGYYAHGGGIIVIEWSKIRGKAEDPEEWLDVQFDNFFRDWEFTEIDNASDISDKYPDLKTVNIIRQDEKWHDEEFNKIFESIAPYIQSGKLKFTGEDGEHWCYVFDTGKVTCYEGTVVYDNEPEIIPKELQAEAKRLIVTAAGLFPNEKTVFSDFIDKLSGNISEADCQKDKDFER